MKKAVVGTVLGVVLLSLLLAVLLKPTASRFNAGSSGGNMIGVIYVEGAITGERASEGLFTGAGASSGVLMRQIKEARENEQIKIVVLRINSPGGSAAASQEIGDEIDKLRKSGKKVVVSMGDVAASGGYWLAAKADKIVANPATTTGSIGVIFQTQSLKELFDKIGVSQENITSGKFKDLGAPNKELTEEERKLLEGMVEDIFEQFVDVVAKGRDMSRAEVLKLADGRVFTGRQAKEAGLVDELGNFYDAIEIAKDMAGIKGEPEIYEFGGGKSFGELFSLKGGQFSFNPEWLTGVGTNDANGLEGFK